MQTPTLPGLRQVRRLAGGAGRGERRRDAAAGQLAGAAVQQPQRRLRRRRRQRLVHRPGRGRDAGARAALLLSLPHRRKAHPALLPAATSVCLSGRLAISATQQRALWRPGNLACRALHLPRFKLRQWVPSCTVACDKYTWWRACVTGGQLVNTFNITAHKERSAHALAAELLCPSNLVCAALRTHGALRPLTASPKQSALCKVWLAWGARASGRLRSCRKRSGATTSARAP